MGADGDIEPVTKTPAQTNISKHYSTEMNFQERLAWLRRMPTRWRVLFGVQGVVMYIAVNIRLSDIERARRTTAEKEAAAAAQAAGGGGAGAEPSNNTAPSGTRGATIVTRTTMGVERRREDI